MSSILEFWFDHKTISRLRTKNYFMGGDFKNSLAEKNRIMAKNICYFRFFFNYGKFINGRCEKNKKKL